MNEEILSGEDPTLLAIVASYVQPTDLPEPAETPELAPERAQEPLWAPEAVQIHKDHSRWSEAVYGFLEAA